MIIHTFGRDPGLFSTGSIQVWFRTWTQYPNVESQSGQVGRNPSVHRGKSTGQDGGQELECCGESNLQATERLYGERERVQKTRVQEISQKRLSWVLTFLPRMSQSREWLKLRHLPPALDYTLNMCTDKSLVRHWDVRQLMGSP